MGLGVKVKIIYAIMALGSFNLYSPAFAACLSLKTGPITFDALGCKKLDPTAIFDMTNSKYSWINDLDPKGRQKILNDYSGLLLKGLVVTSKAQDKGLSKEVGVLQGETVYIYMPPSPNSCKQVLGLRLAGDLQEKCCDGGGDIPCLLNTTYLFKSVKAVGKASSDAGDATRTRSKVSKDYQLAMRAFVKKNWKVSVEQFEKAKGTGSLDVKGHYRLAYSYRELENCKKAIEPLEYIRKLELNKKIWEDEEKVAKRSKFLLARCYAKLNDPASAYLILQSYLLESTKYRYELRQSLKHKDFGWIHTSKEYRDYEKEAKKKLRSK